MRRPLSDAGLIFILILLILKLIIPDVPVDISGIESHTVSVSARLVRKEVKIKDGEETLIWYIQTPLYKGSEICPNSKDMVMCFMSQSADDCLLGTRVTVRGSIRGFEPATNPGVFDSAKYYRIMHVAFRMFDAVPEAADESTVTPYYRLCNRLQRLRSNIGILCDLCFDEEDSGIIRGILLGDKSYLDADTKVMYSRNGIAHILAISGLHISMLGTGLAFLLKKCRVNTPIRCSIVILLMILYGIMTGMAASAARAIIMFSFRMTAEILKRTYDAATALTIAAVMVLTANPSYLFYSGFQFSFGAICAVLLVIPILEDVFPKLVSGGLSVNIITLPIYLHNYYYFPILSVLLNLYIIPLMSVLLGMSIVAVAGCVIYIPLGRILAFPVHLILRIYEYSCRLCDLIPWNRYVTGKPAVVLTMVYIILIALILVFRSRQTRMQILLHLCAAGIILTIRLYPGISVTTIDVGQGDGIYISDNSGTDIMIDGGSSSVSEVGKYRLAPFLFSQGVASLDAVFITHLDSDHYIGLLEMIEDGGLSSPRIEHLYLTCAEEASGSETYERIVDAAVTQNIPIDIIRQGDIYRRGGLYLECLYPDESCTGEDTNDESLVMHLRYRNTHMLFTGDLGGSGETALCSVINNVVRPEDTLILKVAHHGSRYSTYDEFLDRSGPDIALISAGRKNRYGHPHAELIERLTSRSIPYFNTARYGAIRVDVTRRGVNVRGYLK